MADIEIPQAEADALIAMEKHRVDDQRWLFPAPGARLAIPLVSPDKREHFMLDVTRATIRLTKATYQNRARQAIILMRLDIDGPPHPNPEVAPVGDAYSWLAPYAGQVMTCPHLHVYIEGYGAKLAVPAQANRYMNVF